MILRAELALRRSRGSLLNVRLTVLSRRSVSFEILPLANRGFLCPCPALVCSHIEPAATFIPLAFISRCAGIEYFLLLASIRTLVVLFKSIAGASSVQLVVLERITPTIPAIIPAAASRIGSVISAAVLARVFHVRVTSPSVTPVGSSVTSGAMAIVVMTMRAIVSDLVSVAVINYHRGRSVWPVNVVSVAYPSCVAI
jgi:hypothetical protein